MIKHILLLTVITFSFLTAQDGNYNYYNFNQSIGIQFDVGYNNFNTTEAEKYFEQSVSSIQERNISIEAQTLYPSNILWGGGVYYYPVPSLSLLLAGEFTKTKAYSLYGDYAGTIDLKSEINFFSIYFGVQKHFRDITSFEPFVGINVGTVRGEFNYEHNITYNDYPEQSRSDDVTYSNFGFKGEAYAGVSYNLDFVVLGLQGGYRYYFIPKPSAKDISGEFRSEDFPFDIEASGFLFRLSLRTGLFW